MFELPIWSFIHLNSPNNLLCACSIINRNILFAFIFILYFALLKYFPWTYNNIWCLSAYFLFRSEQKPSKEDKDLKRLSPFSEMSRRDEGDGRSIADSNYSSYKNQKFMTYHAPDNKSSKTNAKIRTIPKWWRKRHYLNWLLNIIIWFFQID